MKRLVVIAAVITLAACNRSNSSAPPPSLMDLPVAVAGNDQKVLVSAVGVILDGSASFDPLGGTPTYQWIQLSGTAVTLTGATTASATFDAPAAPGTLVFELAVTTAEGTDVDTVTVTVKRMLVSAMDAWFVGYGNPGTIQATVTGGAGPYDYTWSGTAPWLNVTSPLTTMGSAMTTNDLVYMAAPLLTDFQNFEDLAGVIQLKQATSGRLQLKISVTDTSNGDTDEDFVNFSVGPFANTVANENVALGEPVFLKGAETDGGTPFTDWTWSGQDPTGAAISFFTPDKVALGGATTERFVYFVPDELGEYQITVTQNPGAAVAVIIITCGQYVGVGNLTGSPPDPFKGECAACHGGQFFFLEDFFNPWKETAHAKAFEEILTPGDSHYAPSQAKGHWNDAFDFGSRFSVDQRTVGWSMISALVNGGWDDQATADGFVFKDATWNELVRKHPATAGLSNVQCESCHGPGSEHAGDSTGIRKSFDALLCGRCHSSKHDQWAASHHADRSLVVSVGGRTSCNNCHTAQGYVVEARAQEGADPHDVLVATGNVNRPALPEADRRTQTCQACHDPHKRTAKGGGEEHGHDAQLRVFGNVRLVNGVTVNAGEAATCYMCHQGRRDTTDPSTAAGRRGPHDSTAAEMLSATNAFEFAGWSYESSPHAIPSRFVSPGFTEPRQCLACHHDNAPSKGQDGYGALGGHTFAMHQGTGVVEADDVSHGAATTTAGSTKLTVAGGSLLRLIFPGDTVTVDGGAANKIVSVDSARQATLQNPAAATTTTTTWGITSVKKYNISACTQCHPGAPAFGHIARGDYDGDGSLNESIQGEIAGLINALDGEIRTSVGTLTGQTILELTSFRGRVGYTYNPGTGNVTRAFPGPAVPSSYNPDVDWASLSAGDQATWDVLYRAAFNILFVKHDHSEGIHNTGYAVNLLQSAYFEVTGNTIGVAFVPY